MRAINRQAGIGGGGVGGSVDHTERIRKKREEILEDESKSSGVEVQRQAMLSERVKSDRQAKADPQPAPGYVSAQERLRRLKEKA